MKVRFIINPHSGHNRRRPWLADHVRAFAQTQLNEASVVLTEAPGHATLLAREAVAAGAEVVVAVGGDGTMNEVAQALVHTPAALALVPCGSGNGLARHLGVPCNLGRALALLRPPGHRVTVIDSARVDDRPFFNAMGVGFDAEVSQRFNRLPRRGLQAYCRATLGLLGEMKTEPWTIRADGRATTLEALLIAIANSDQYGNNARIAPGARVDDGRLDLVAIKTAGWWTLASLAPRLFLGNLDRSARVVRLCSAQFTIERGRRGVMHVDGDTYPAEATVNVAVVPRSLRVVVPRFA